MPPSSSVFGRFARQISGDESNPGTTTTTPQAAEPIFDGRSHSGKDRWLSVPRRESLVLSAPDSVAELSESVRRSVSLRSHRPQHPPSSPPPAHPIGHRARYPSSSTIVTTSSSLPSTDEALEETKATRTPSLPTARTPPRSRGKLGIYARSLSQRYKSTDTLPLFNTPDQLDGGAKKPSAVPLTSRSISQPSMLATATAPRRQPSERPSLASQPSFARDVPSSHGGPNGPPTAVSTITTVTTTGGVNPSAIYHIIHEAASKRMATIDYMRKMHDGNIYYFNTLHYTPSSLSTVPSLMPHKLGRRATNYLLLGYSLPVLLDMYSSSPQDYLKALCSLLQEYETYHNLAGLDTSSSSSLSRARVGQMFKSGIGLNRSTLRTGRRASAATDSISLDTSKAGLQSPSTTHPADATGSHSSPDVLPPSPVNLSGHDFHYLLTPHIPFEPDFRTTFATLCDTLIDSYAKLLELVSSPDVCNPGVGEAFAKADKAVRKILVSSVMREFEDTTRASVKGEVAGLGKLVLGGLM